MEDIYLYIKLLLALVCGGIIGWERQIYHKYAGMRTHTLVCIGTALLTALAVDIYGITDMAGRIVAGIITGIGFLGAGMIMNGKGNVRGLTSAATIWITGVIGIIVGYGYYFLGAVATLVTILTLLLKEIKNNN
jgi:putative Mg2+ transporter-C (MgtC) family protein